MGDEVKSLTLADEMRLLMNELSHLIHFKGRTFNLDILEAVNKRYMINCIINTC